MSSEQSGSTNLWSVIVEESEVIAPDEPMWTVVPEAADATTALGEQTLSSGTSEWCIVSQGCFNGSELLEADAMTPEIAAGHAPATPLLAEAAVEFTRVSMETGIQVQAVLSAIAPPSTGEARASLRLVASIDKSGSMRGRKLDLVKRTLLHMLTFLSSKDALGIVEFDTDVNVVCNLTPCNEGGKAELSCAIARLRAGSQTNLCGGLLQGLQLHKKEILEAGGDAPTVVRSTFLFTDGMANVGDSNPKSLCEQAETQLVHQGTQVTLSTFGFGSHHNANLLQDLAALGKGTYNFIESEDNIGQAFGEALGGLLSTTHQDVKLTLKTAPGVSLVEALTSYPVEHLEDGGATITLGDLFAEERRDVLVTVALPLATTEGSQTLATLSAEGMSVLNDQLEQHLQSLDIDRMVHPVSVEKHPQVVKHGLRHLATSAMAAARAAADRGALGEGRRLLQQAADTLASRPAALQGDAICSGLSTDVTNCLYHMREQQVYHSTGSKTLTCVMGSHRQQRTCGQGDLSGTICYQTQTQSDMSVSFTRW